MSPLEKLRLDYRLRLFFRHRWKRLVCKHRETYASVSWTGSSVCCTWCHKTISSKSHGVGEEGRVYYKDKTLAETYRWIITGEWK